MNLDLDDTDGVLGFLWAMKWIFIGAVVLIVAIAGLVLMQSSYREEHHCVRTGKDRLDYFQQVGTVLVPVFEYEYRCDGGELRWW
jgi:hypothetical protein